MVPLVGTLFSSLPKRLYLSSPPKKRYSSIALEQRRQHKTLPFTLGYSTQNQRAIEKTMFLINKIRIDRNFQNYIFAWNQHTPLVDRCWPLATTKRVPLKASIQFTYIPLVWCTLYGLRAVMFVWTISHRTWARPSAWESFWLRAGEKYTRSSATNVQVCVVLWTINFIMMNIKDLTGLTLNKLQFLIVYSVGTVVGRVLPRSLCKHFDECCI